MWKTSSKYNLLNGKKTTVSLTLSHYLATDRCIVFNWITQLYGAWKRWWSISRDWSIHLPVAVVQGRESRLIQDSTNDQKRHVTSNIYIPISWHKCRTTVVNTAYLKCIILLTENLLYYWDQLVHLLAANSHLSTTTLYLGINTQICNAIGHGSKPSNQLKCLVNQACKMVRLQREFNLIQWIDFMLQVISYQYIIIWIWNLVKYSGVKCTTLASKMY